MKTCLLLGAKENEPVCGAFLFRAGSSNIDQLRMYLDEIERKCEISKTDLLGMVIWTNEQFNINMRCDDQDPEPFPYPTDKDGWICSVCYGWNVPKDRVCMHSHLSVPLKDESSWKCARSLSGNHWWIVQKDGTHRCQSCNLTSSQRKVEP